MGKKTIAILFSILFVGFIAAPSIILAVDDTVDVSIFYSVAEEENEILKLPLPENNSNKFSNLFLTNTKESLGYYFKKYTKPHLNLISPPPEQVIL